MPLSAECQSCQDTGYVVTGNTASRCPECDARFRASIGHRLRAVAGIPERFAGSTFDAADLTLHDDLPTMYEAGRRWVSRKGKPWLVVIGMRGCGKTRLSTACANALIDNGREVRFIEAAEFVDETRKRQGEFGASEAYRDDIAHSPYLVLDELAGGDLNTDFKAETIERLIRIRYNDELPLLITSNLSMKAIAEKCERAASRLMEEAEIVIASRGVDLRELSA